MAMLCRRRYLGRNVACRPYCCPYCIFGQGRQTCGADGENHSPEPLCRGYSLEDVGVKEKIPYLEKLNEKIFSLDNRVRKVQAYL